ncbi:DUF4360 domain-containing protein [Kitasatospora sp. NPDC017646]|uniref:DUF4360 domain-containing protein n=1 Tax=Kitasatospora sp. NPDC017646 TaxID=3364024 RepID=UPI0037A9814A
MVSGTAWNAWPGRERRRRPRRARHDPDAPTDFRKDCQLDLTLHVPGGCTYAIVSAGYSGFASPAPGASDTQRAGHHFQGDARTTDSTHHFKGGFTGGGRPAPWTSPSPFSGADRCCTARPGESAQLKGIAEDAIGCNRCEVLRYPSPE